MGRPVFHDLDLAGLVQHATAAWVAYVEAPDVVQAPGPALTAFHLLDVVYGPAWPVGPVVVGCAHYATHCERDRQARLGRTFSYPAWRYHSPSAVLDAPPYAPRLVFVQPCREPGVAWELAAQGAQEDLAALAQVRALAANRPA